MGMKHFRLPDPGEGLVEAEIVSWKVAPGDTVTVNQIVVEIETAKSLVELPIPWAGTVQALLVNVGDTVEVGTPIVTIDAPGLVGDEEGPSSRRSGLIPSEGPSSPPSAGTAPAVQAAAGDDVVSEGWAGEAEPAAGAPAGRVFTMPDPGEGLVEAEIVSWKVKPGDTVTVNQIVVEVETAKSLVELPIPWAGTVTALLVNEGDTVAVGSPIIEIDGAGAGGRPAAAPPQDKQADAAPKREAILVGYGAAESSTKRRARRGAAAPQAAAPAAASPAVTAMPAAAARPAQVSGPVNPDPRTKPPLRKLAKDRGVDLTQVPGTGPEGIITRADLEGFLAGAGSSDGVREAHAAEAVDGAAYAPPQRAQASGERETRVPIKGVRKATAQAMVSSAFTAPHVTEWLTVDATGLMEFTESLKADRELKGLKISPMLVFSKMVLLALKRNPGFVSRWDEATNEIVTPHYVNLGFAAATPRGLMVPNIKDADQMSFRELAEAFSHYIDLARGGKLQPADYSGGTITITNVGVFGVDAGTPIINPGESSIIAFGTVRRMPWVVERDGVESIEPRWVTTLAASFDHRVIDGELGSRFLADLGRLVTDPSAALLWS